MRERVTSEKAYWPALMISVTDEGREQYTQRQGDEGWRDRGGWGQVVLSLIKQWLISQGGVAHSGLRGHESGDLRWSGSQHGSSSCQWGRPRARWGPGPLKLRPLRWGSTCHLRPAGILRLSESNKHKRGVNTARTTPQIYFTPFCGLDGGVYLHQTDLQSDQMAAPAPGRCWWSNSGPQREFASRGTCMSTPGCLAGSSGSGYGPRRSLQAKDRAGNDLRGGACYTKETMDTTWRWSLEKDDGFVCRS